MTRARIDQDSIAGVIGRSHDRGEGAAELALEHGPGRLHRAPRRQAGLEVCAQRKAHQRRVGQRLASVSGDVTDDHRQLAVLEGKHVVEVAAGARTGRRSISRRGAHWPEPRRQDRKQRSLKQADVLEQLTTLMLQSPGAQR